MYAGFIYLPEVLVLCFGPSVASPIKLPHITNMGCFRVHIAYLCMAVTSISIFDGCRALYGIIMIYIVHPVLMHLGVSSFLLLFCYYNAAVNIFCSFLCLCLKVLLWGRFPEMCCVENRGCAFKILIENVELPCIMAPRPFTAARVYSLPPSSVLAEAEWSWDQFVGEFNAIWHFLKKPVLFLCKSKAWLSLFAGLCMESSSHTPLPISASLCVSV